MKRQPLDIYDDFPKPMKAYLRNYGWHFNKKSYEWAVKHMKSKASSGQLEPVELLNKEEVDELLKKYNVILEYNVGYDYMYVAAMCKADYLKSSVPDEQHMALFVKDTIDDPDGADGMTFRRWYASMVALGIPIEWDDLI